MSRFFPNAKRSLDSLLSLITDLVSDGLLFFRLLFRSRTALTAEVLFLRKQLAFYEERHVQPRRLNNSARFSLILWSRLCNWKEALVIVKPETLIGRHRKGFKLFWKWKSQAGRPRIPENVRKLIVQMAQENPTSEGCIIEVRGHREIPFGPNDLASVRVNHKRWNFRGWSDAPRSGTAHMLTL